MIDPSKLIPADNVIVLKDFEIVEEGGLKITDFNDADRKKPEVGKAVRVGKGEQPFQDIVIEPGDVVFFEKYLENRVFYNGTKFNFIRFDKVLSVIKAKDL